MNTANRTFYDVLGVSRDTPAVVVKAAYRALAKEYHPDGGGGGSTGDAEKFIELQNAYAVLSDARRRKSYDDELEQADDDGQGGGDPIPDAGAVVPGGPAALDGRSGEVRAVYSRLALYSDALAASFLDAAAAGRGDGELFSYAALLEDRFFSEYFGDDADVRALAKLLLLRAKKAAVVELNDVIAADRAPGADAGRLVLRDFVDRHLAEDELFAEWLKAKFAPARRRAERVENIPVPAKLHPAVPLPGKAKRAPRTHRRPERLFASVRLFCWSFALYFGLFAVTTLAD